MRFNFDDYYKPSKPKEVTGGIKSSGNKKDIAKNWWSKKWLDVLESFHLGARLGRGRSYARSGQVMTLTVTKGSIVAEVQGSRAKPYQVEISFNRFDENQWDKIINKLTASPLFCAQLLNGIMPADIEELFLSLKLNLFPSKWKDLNTECSCPDWSNPCKHIAAVFFLMAEAFDNNPFILFELRGMTQSEMMEKLAGLDLEQSEECTEIPAEPLPADPEKFWGKEQERLDLPARKTTLHAAIPKRLGRIGFWRSSVDLPAMMDALYKSVSSRTLNLRQQILEKRE